MSLQNKYLDYSVVELDNMIKGSEGQLKNPPRGSSIEKIEQNIERMKEAMQIKNEATLSEELPFEVLVARKYQQTYDNAMRRGKEFTLTFNHLKKLMKQKKCAYTGVAFSDEPQMNLTLERLDGSLGYTNSNTVAVTYFANSLKNQLLEQESSPMLTDFDTLKMFVYNLDKLMNKEG